MATKAQNNETRKVNKLRYAEYYGQQPILDGLYADSKDGRIFKNLMPLILSQKNILQAYRTMKGNKGSHTPGTDALTIENIEAMEAKALCTEVKRRLGNYQPSPVRRKEIPKPNGKTRPLGIAINASISTGIILEDLCRRMELPCYIGGFTSLVGGLQYISYVEYGSVDAKDKYRLTGMSSCGGTPTGMAIRYMTARLKMLMCHKVTHKN